jgi:hypothetical protein
MKNIIFIGGVHGRSGTTIMKKLLCIHPQVSWVLGNESQYLEVLADFLPNVLNTECYLPRNAGLAFQKFKASICKRFGSSIELDRLMKSLEMQIASRIVHVPRFGDLPIINPLTEDQAVNLINQFTLELFCQALINPKAEFGCEKTPSNAQYLKLAHTFFPNTRMIVMVRHPVHTALSFLPKDWGPSDPLEAAYYTHLHFVRWQSVVQTVPNTFYRLIRLEDLINDPEGNLLNVGQFVGLTWTPRHLEKAVQLMKKPLDRRTALAPDILAQMEKVLAKDIGYFESLKT